MAEKTTAEKAYVARAFVALAWSGQVLTAGKGSDARACSVPVLSAWALSAGLTATACVEV